MRNHAGFLLLLLLAGCAGSRADAGEDEMTTKTVEYTIDGTAFEGFLARPAGDGPFPGVLVCHAWKGIRDHERTWAKRLAGEGYVAFCADVYGKGVRPETREEAGAQAGKLRGDRALLRKRARAGLDQLRAQAGVDPDHLAAIGFCFGGGTVLELARSGADVAGVVSLHGNLDTPDPADAKAIRGRVLVLSGAVDPHVPMESVKAFVDEMEAAKVDYRVTLYGGAVHAFTDPSAGDDPSRGAAYDERAARRSWADTVRFLSTLFAGR